MFKIQNKSDLAHRPCVLIFCTFEFVLNIEIRISDFPVSDKKVDQWDAIKQHLTLPI